MARNSAPFAPSVGPRSGPESRGPASVRQLTSEFVSEGHPDKVADRTSNEMMPAPIQYAHRLVERLAGVRKAGEAWLGPNAKSQVTLTYADGAPVHAAHGRTRPLSG